MKIYKITITSYYTGEVLYYLIMFSTSPEMVRNMLLEYDPFRTNADAELFDIEELIINKK